MDIARNASPSQPGREAGPTGRPLQGRICRGRAEDRLPGGAALGQVTMVSRTAHPKDAPLPLRTPFTLFRWDFQRRIRVSILMGLRPSRLSVPERSCPVKLSEPVEEVVLHPFRQRGIAPRSFRPCCLEAMDGSPLIPGVVPTGVTHFGAPCHGDGNMIRKSFLQPLGSVRPANVEDAARTTGVGQIVVRQCEQVDARRGWGLGSYIISSTRFTKGGHPCGRRTISLRLNTAASRIIL